MPDTTSRTVTDTHRNYMDCLVCKYTGCGNIKGETLLRKDPGVQAMEEDLMKHLQ